MPKENYELELTHEEALMLVFLSSSSGVSNSRVQTAIDSVAAALRGGDPSLQTEQAQLWVRSEKPLFDLSYGPEADV